MTGFTDIHSHFVYGVDDGPGTKARMEAMLDAAHADGIAALFATPHRTPGVRPFDEAAYLEHLREAQGYCQSQGYAMTLHTGAEIMYTPALRNYAVDHRLPTLDGSDRILMEFVPDVTQRELEDALDLTQRCGYVTVLAHMERYACLFRGNIAERLKARYDVCYQMNTDTILNERGFFRARRIRSWLQEGLVSFVASDAHDVKKRTFQMKMAYAVLKEKYGPSEAERLTGRHTVE